MSERRTGMGIGSPPVPTDYDIERWLAYVREDWPTSKEKLDGRMKTLEFGVKLLALHIADERRMRTGDGSTQHDPMSPSKEKAASEE